MTGNNAPRFALIALSLLLLSSLTPLVAAHGGPHGGGRFDFFSPRSYGTFANLTADGTITRDAVNESGSVNFPMAGTDSGAPGTVTWTYEVPWTFTVEDPGNLSLKITANQPVAPGLAGQGQEDPFGFAFGLDGEPLMGTMRNVTVESSALAPGDSVWINTTVPIPQQAVFEAGSTLELWAYNRIPGMENSLSIQVGGNSGQFDLPFVQAPTLADIQLDTDPYTPRESQNFEFNVQDEDTIVKTVTVFHEEVTWDGLTTDPNQTVVLLFKGQEPKELARQEHGFFTVEERNENAHWFKIGDTEFATYPGTTIPVKLTVTELTSFQCTKNCPAGDAFFGTIFVNQTTNTTEQNVTTTNTSDDGTLPVPSPGPAIGALLAAGVALALRHRRDA